MKLRYHERFTTKIGSVTATIFLRKRPDLETELVATIGKETFYLGDETMSLEDAKVKLLFRYRNELSYQLTNVEELITELGYKED